MLTTVLVHQLLRMMVMRVMVLLVLVIVAHELLMMIEIWHAHQTLVV